MLTAEGVEFDRGLTNKEVEQIERIFAFKFPPPLEQFLKFKLPVTKRFCNWRLALNDQQYAKKMQARLDWPVNGILFDVEYNDFWHPDWAVKPIDWEACVTLVKAEVARYPKLIPIYSHRYLPALDDKEYPVLSVYQTDIIYYGCNLVDYLHGEFYRESPIGRPKKYESIPGWSYFVEEAA